MPIVCSMSAEYGFVTASVQMFRRLNLSTVHCEGNKTIPVRCFESSIERAPVRVSIASDGKKLSLFMTTKGQPNGRIEKNLHDVLSENTYACCQKKRLNGCAESKSLDWVHLKALRIRLRKLCSAIARLFVIGRRLFSTSWSHLKQTWSFFRVAALAFCSHAMFRLWNHWSLVSAKSIYTGPRWFTVVWTAISPFPCQSKTIFLLGFLIL